MRFIFYSYNNESFQNQILNRLTPGVNLMLTRIIFSISLLLFLSTLNYTEAGNFPFPQNVKFHYGIAPGAANSAHAKESYTNWKTKYYANVEPDMGRVHFNSNNEVVSEGIAYGMLLSSYGDDRDVFDRLWRYYKNYMNSRGVMHWRINSAGVVIGQNGATDAEEDAAMALIVAHYQWGSDNGSIDYMGDAITLINNMMEHEVEKPSYILKPGDAWGGSNITNPSYFAPAYYRIFYQITGDEQWIKVLEKSYEILSVNAHPTTGLVSDWCNGAGVPTPPTASRPNANRYHYDAARMPWRLATDYLWFGEERANNLCTKMAVFLRDVVKGSYRVVDGYEQNGTGYGTTHSPVFVGPFAVGLMGTGSAFQKQMNTAYTDISITQDNEYFASCLRAISLYMLTGNFYRLPIPECSKPSLGEDVSLCTQSSYTLSSGINNTTGYKFTWSTGSNEEQIEVNTPGIIWLRADSAGCVHYDSLIVSSINADIGPADTTIPVSGLELVVDNEPLGATYLWSTGEVTETIKIRNEGTYWVKVDSAGCFAIDSINVIFQPGDSFEVYPNPSRGLFKLMIYNPEAKLATIDVFDSRGSLVRQLRKEDIIIGNEIEMDLRDFSSGIYYLVVSVNEKKETIKVLIR